MKPTLSASILMLAGAMCLPTFSARAEEPSGPTEAPAVQAADGQAMGDVASLIGQLGDDDFHVRLSASGKLKAMGPSVIPALKAARQSQDPEIHAQADDILEELEHPLAGLQVPQPSGFGSQMMRASNVNGVRIIDVQESGRITHIEINNSGISMKVTGQLDGRKVTREFKAKSAAQLQHDNAQAFALFQQFAGNGSRAGAMGNRVFFQQAGNFRINNGAIIVPNANRVMLQPVPRPNLNGDNLERLEDNLLGQMKTRNLPDKEQEEVKGLLKQLREGVPPANNADVDAQMREYDRRCDALRQKLGDLKLPDPGDILPPPASSRLGINVVEQPDNGGGLMVMHIQPGSRAEKLGLKELDIVQKINGQAVHTTPELRKLVTDHAKGLVVEGMRDGKVMKLQE